MGSFAAKGPVVNGPLESIKVVEVLTTAGAGYYGRNHVNGTTVTDDMRGMVRPGTDTLRAPYIEGPRELDDYHLAGIYGLAGVPYEISELILTEAAAEKKYGADYPKYQALAKELSDEVYNGLTNGQGVFVVGTNCAPAVGVAGGVRRAYGDDTKLGIIYLDAHGDINTRYSTFSGSMGGMDLAPIVGLDQEDWWAAACGGEMKPFDASLHGCGRDLDSGIDATSGQPFGEMINLNQAGTIVATTADFNNEAIWSAKLKEFADKVDVIYLHIDADVVDNAFIPNVNTPEPGGPDIWTVMKNIKSIMDTDKVAVVKLASVYFGREYNASQLLQRGFVFPAVPGETAQQASNRASQIAILTGIRMISTAFVNWTDIPAVGASGPVATPSAFVTKLNGNQNDLTISVKEVYANGKVNTVTATFKINNNAAGTYKVGDYKVYVDTKGNTQINAIYIVN